MEDQKNRKRFIRRAEVLDMTGLPVSTLYRYMNNGTFPMPVKIGERSVAWIEDEVERWQFERMRINEFDRTIPFATS